ncbi:MAG: GNAT family N-acetyltransferase [Verrucomicrobium sp.]|nr:GNAT family N-acetyltransferase [Verrucomicrobium sp.]
MPSRERERASAAAVRKAPARELSPAAARALTRRGESSLDFALELEDHGIQVDRMGLDRKQWRQFMGPGVTPANFWEKVLPGLDLAGERRVRISSPDLMQGKELSRLDLELKASVKDRDGKFVPVELEWRIEPREKTGRLAMLSLDAAGRGRGLGEALFERTMAFFRDRGVERVTMRANIDVGGYLWPQKGFFAQDLGEAAAMLGDGPAYGAKGQIHAQIESLRAAIRRREIQGGLSKEEREQTREFAAELDQAQRIVEDGRRHVAAGNLRAAQLAVPMVAALRAETPEFLIRKISADNRGALYAALRADTLGKALLCGTACEAAYDFRDARCRRLYSPKPTA